MGRLFRRTRFLYYRRVPGMGLLLIFSLIALLIFILMLFVVERNLKPTIKDIGEARARQIATEVVNDAIKQKVAENVEYQDLIAVQKDSQGRIVLMQPDISGINGLASDTTLSINEALKDLENQRFSIPLGQVLGNQLLANCGPSIKVKIYPVGSVQTSVIEQFEEAGINQSRHCIYLDIQSQIKVVVPLLTSQIKVSAQVPVSDTVIVGQVPDTYVKLDAGGF